MSHFYADIKGSRGQATRCGTKNSGIRGHIRGWNIGIQVYGGIDENGNDTFSVYLTGGSAGHKTAKLIYEATESDLD